MNKYEITIITKENPAGGGPVKKEIESLDGKVLDANTIGQRKLIFPIKKETAGYYTVVNFEISPEKVLELNKKLSLKSEILRYLILTAEAAKTAAPKVAKKAEKSIEPEIIAQPIEESKEEITEKPKEEKAVEKPIEISPAAVEPKQEKKAAKKPVTVKAPEKPKASPAATEIEKEEMSADERLKALDKKLDELLKE